MAFSDVSSVTNHFVTPNEGFSTATSGAVSSGATTVGLNSVSGLTNGSIFVGVIEPAGTKEQIFTGVVDTSGSQITGVKWIKGTNVAHAIGVSVVDYDTGAAFKMMRKGIEVEHNQDGTHDETIITSRTEDSSPADGDYVLTSDISASNALKKVTRTNFFSNPPLGAGSVDPEDLVSGTGTDWAWPSWIPTLTNITEGNGTKTGKYIQIGKTVFYKFQFTLGSTSAMGTDPQFSLPVTAIASDANAKNGWATFRDAGTETYFGGVYLNATSTAKFFSHATDGTWLRASSTPPDSGRPFTWTTNDIITAVGFYEAA